MKSQVEELSPIERKLSIEVEPAQVAQELDRAYSALGRQVKVPGFRPGKVPRRILEQRYRAQVEDDVIQRVVERAYLEALREHQVEAVASPRITQQGLKVDAPFAFEARVEVRPKVEPKDYAGLELQKVEVAVDEARVAEQLERIRQMLGRLEPVEGRELAQRGDYATIDFDASVDGKPFPGSQAEGLTVEVTEGDLLRGNAVALEGAKVGETREVDYTFPDDYSVEEVRGKAAKFRLHLRGLKAQVTPELNDELAKEVGGGDTLEELQGKIRGDLEKAERREAERKEREQIIGQLLTRNPFEVPGAMVDRAIDLMLRGALRQMAERGMDPRMMQLDFDALREELRPKALQEVKGTLMFEAIAQKEGVSASDEEIDARIEQIAEEEKTSAAVVRKRYKDPSEREALGLRLREEKTIEFLRSRAKY
jgi:trigger factor